MFDCPCTEVKFEDNRSWIKEGRLRQLSRESWLVCWYRMALWKRVEGYFQPKRKDLDSCPSWAEPDVTERRYIYWDGTSTSFWACCTQLRQIS